MRKLIIKKGDKFGMLTAIRFIEMRGNGYQYWLFKCICGTEKAISVSSVKIGGTKSCGCSLRKRKNNLRHGMTDTRIYISWQSMRQRCLNESHPRYKDWGGRGITICPEWLGKNGFINFLADMGERPDKLSLDRIDNEGNYTPENCRWADAKTQNNNQRKNDKDYTPK